MVDSHHTTSAHRDWLKTDIFAILSRRGANRSARKWVLSAFSFFLPSFVLAGPALPCNLYSATLSLHRFSAACGVFAYFTICTRDAWRATTGRVAMQALAGPHWSMGVSCSARRPSMQPLDITVGGTACRVRWMLGVSGFSSVWRAPKCHAAMLIHDSFFFFPECLLEPVPQN
ncbi:hypothetical protein VTN02DRAFT_1806 [Thermoascus thermophilus]